MSDCDCSMYISKVCESCQKSQEHENEINKLKKENARLRDQVMALSNDVEAYLDLLKKQAKLNNKQGQERD